MNKTMSLEQAMEILSKPPVIESEPTSGSLQRMVRRGVCPYCGLDAMTGPLAHADRKGCIDAMRTMHLNYRRRVGNFVMNRLEEVKNQIGGVTGYRLQLNADETEKLCREIESA